MRNSKWNEGLIVKEIIEKDIDSVSKWNKVSSGSYRHAKDNKDEMAKVFELVSLKGSISKCRKLDQSNPVAFRAYIASEYKMELPERAYRPPVVEEPTEDEVVVEPVIESKPEVKPAPVAPQQKKVKQKIIENPTVDTNIQRIKADKQPKDPNHKPGPNSGHNLSAIDALLKGG